MPESRRRKLPRHKRSIIHSSQVLGKKAKRFLVAIPACVKGGDEEWKGGLYSQLRRQGRRLRVKLAKSLASPLLHRLAHLVATPCPLYCPCSFENLPLLLPLAAPGLGARDRLGGSRTGRWRQRMRCEWVCRPLAAQVDVSGAAGTPTESREHGCFPTADCRGRQRPRQERYGRGVVTRGQVALEDRTGVAEPQTENSKTQRMLSYREGRVIRLLSK